MLRSRRQSSSTAVWALALIALSLGVTWALLDDFLIWLTGVLHLPLLGAWLGARYGGKGLTPVWIATPFMALYLFVSPAPAAALGLGAGLEIAVLTICAACAFSAERPRVSQVDDEPEEAEAAGQSRSPLPLRWLLAAAALLVSAATVELRLGGYDAGLSLGFFGFLALPIAAFLTVAAGLAPAAFVAAGVTAICVAARLAEPALSVSFGGDDWASLDLAWGQEPLSMLATSIPATLAGALLRPLWRDGLPLRAGRGFVALFVSAFALTFALPPALTAGDEAYAAWRERQAQASAPSLSLVDIGRSALAIVDPPAAAQSDEGGSIATIVVTGSAIYEPSTVVLGSAFYLTLGALAFAAASAWPRSAPGWLPPSACALALLGAALTAAPWTWSGDEHWDSPALELVREQLGLLVAVALIAWSFAWFGAREGAPTARREEPAP